MAKVINTTFRVMAPKPLDERTQVATYQALSNIPIKFHGLKVYVEDEDVEYRYYRDLGWVEWSSENSSGGDAIWGFIEGDIESQVDLQSALNLKFDKSGGTIYGNVDVLGTVTAYNHIAYSSEPTIELPYVPSTVLGEPVGSIVIKNIVKISAADYASAQSNGTLVSTTWYIII